MVTLELGGRGPAIVTSSADISLAAKRIAHVKFMNARQICRYYTRLYNLLEKTQGKIVYGGKRNPKTRFFAPTIINGVTTNNLLLSEELFGPILPLLDATLKQAISYTVKHDYPLALYGFTSSQAEKDQILRLINSGGVCFNNAILHMLVKDAPFGGVSASEMGAYHGPFGFQEFTHLRTVVNVPGWMELVLKD
ncbi:aldehyde dehydrogenase [Pochonia chlamydosporia 170]|uniref:Aldehyde dehydrogenase n=1 Tax=Pochonia chlamydosporia 170 TaxID=1380566 RepID=A0A179FEQ7_METCM|nr:aldehyde dehydrogenase [Pochonia chlamydosporia 170]OAQ63721.2 aldehyde dehydrogenase [Pochonia chlamydosporia 170]